MISETLTLQFDGGSRGNPGPAGIGVVIRAADGTAIFTLGRYVGRCTNNVAEYTALITGLEEARRLGAHKLVIRGDSELIIKQMKGEYRVKHPDMKVLYERAQSLVREFDEVKITHNLREHNELADKLANLAMDRKADVTDADESSSPRPAADHIDAPSAVAPKPGDRFQCRRCGCQVEVVIPSRLRPHQLKPLTCQCGQPMD
jgi:ribonuclease HI